MPRAPDPHLEERVVTAALCLLDEHGLEAVTMRSVAAAAGTTTPTLYERFTDRDDVLKGLVLRVQDSMISTVQSARSAEGFVKAYIKFSCQYPHRFELGIRTFGSRLASAEPMPVFDILRQILEQETSASGRALEDLALAVAALIFGTAQGMIAAGADHRRAMGLQRACLSALKLLLAVFRKK
jgi:AcrR family transcriptional regulator